MVSVRQKPGKILFIVIDQFRADLLGGALGEHIALPNLRALQKEAATFSRHYTVATPCGPSRASMLTGLYAMNHRSVRNGTPLDRRLPTIATELRSAGYDPLLFGYTDTSTDPFGRHPNDPDLKNYEGLAEGFAEIVRMRFESNTSWRADLKAKGYDLPQDYWDMFRAQAPSGGQAGITDPALYAAEDSDSAFLANQTIKELSVREAESWFAAVTFIRPHPPLCAPAPYHQMYAPADLPPPVRPVGLNVQLASHAFFAANHAEPRSKGLFIGFDGRMDQLSDAQTAELRAVYCGLATEVDHHIGRLLDSLKATGQYDDTLIIVTADHGENLGDHHCWGKQTPFESSFHIPLIIRDPRQKQSFGTEVAALSESTDLMPTVLDWAGQEAPLGCNGFSLLPWLAPGAKPAWREHVFAEVDLGGGATPSRFESSLGLDALRCNFAVWRDARYKLVYFNGGLPPWLFDLEKDPDEAHNLAEEPEMQATLLACVRAMLDHRMTRAHHDYSRMHITETGIKTIPS